MTTYQQMPTYYRVTWTGNSPFDYTSAGAISPFNSIQMNNTIAITNTNESPTFSNGDTIFCNDFPIGPFSNVTTISNVVTAFNEVTQFTGVIASESFPGYLTLQNIDSDGQGIYLTNGSGTPVGNLGLSAGSDFSLRSPVYSGSASGAGNGGYIFVNGANVAFTGNTVASAVSTFNQSSQQTNIVASQYTNGNIQLNSLDGSPIYFGQGSNGINGAIGFASNTAYAGGMTYDLAIAFEQANMLWKGIINSVESIVTPIYWGSINIAGGNTTDGSNLPNIVSWTIGIPDPIALVTATLVGEPEPVGTLLYGTAALTRLIARGLVGTYQENRKVFNNTVTIRSGYACRENPVNIVYVTANPLDVSGNVHLIEGNLSVTMIGNA